MSGRVFRRGNSWAIAYRAGGQEIRLAARTEALDLARYVPASIRRLTIGELLDRCLLAGPDAEPRIQARRRRPSA